jgi:hypothetical protein
MYACMYVGMCQYWHMKNHTLHQSAGYTDTHCVVAICTFTPVRMQTHTYTCRYMHTHYQTHSVFAGHFEIQVCQSPIDTYMHKTRCFGEPNHTYMHTGLNTTMPSCYNDSIRTRHEHNQPMSAPCLSTHLHANTRVLVSALVHIMRMQLDVSV